MADQPPPFFAMHVLRALQAPQAAEALGDKGCLLIAFLAANWDRIRYSRPMAYRIEALMRMARCEHRSAYYKLEQRCVDAGWLVKTSRGGRQAPVYQVAIPPGCENTEPPPPEDAEVTNLVSTPCVHDTPPVDTKSGHGSGHENGHERGHHQTSPVPIPRESPTPSNPQDTTSAQEADQWTQILAPRQPQPAQPVDFNALSDAVVLEHFRLVCRWRTSDAESTDENIKTLLALAREYGPRTREIAKMWTQEKCVLPWPNQLHEAVLDDLAERAEADRIQAMRNRPKPPPPHQWYERAMAIAKDLTPKQLADILHTGVVRGPQWYDMVLEQDGHARNLIAWHERQTGKGTAA